MSCPLHSNDDGPPSQTLLGPEIAPDPPQTQSGQNPEDNKTQTSVDNIETGGACCDGSTLYPDSLKNSNKTSTFNEEKEDNGTLRFIWLHTFRNLVGRKISVGLPFFEASRPGILTVARCLFVLGLFLIVLVAAAAVPVGPMRIVVAILGVLMTAMLCILCVQDIYDNKKNSTQYHKRSYKPNLGNTIAVVLFTIPLFASLFCATWYPKLRRDILVTTTDSVESVRFPSVAIFQRKDWSSQANLLGGYSKCFLGWYNDTAPECSSLPEGSLDNNQACKCEELWYNDDEVVEEFVWQNISYRYLAFESAPWMYSSTPTYLMLLQAFFNYNSTKAMADASVVNPTLLISLYDPQLGMQEAFDKGYTTMNLVSANGIVSVNVGLRVQQTENNAPAYSYDLSISSSSSTSLVCDSNKVLSYPCFMSLFIQIPNFYRTIISTQKENSWGDVVSSAGSFFSFVQFLGWIISAQAFTS